MFIARQAQTKLLGMLERHAAVGLLGPRQAGKSTLARLVAQGRPSVFLDLEDRADQAKIAEPELFLAAQGERLIILDEIQRQADLFTTLRVAIDRGRREGRRFGQFLVLGSASPALLRQSAESLAGRIAYLELTPLLPTETAPAPVEHLWVRGGFPESFLAATDTASLEWRLAFIRTYLESDIPQLRNGVGARLPAETLSRLWTMLAHSQGGLLNAAKLAGSLTISGQTVARAIDLMVDLLLVRRLKPWSSNLGKRVTKSPKVYVRDSGLLHALLGIHSLDQLLGHPVSGPSWEGFVLETLIAAAPMGTEAHFYRTAAGSEIDIVLKLSGGELWAVEIKRTLAPKAEKGFVLACEDVQPARAFVLYAGQERFPIGHGAEAIGLMELAALLAAR